jgi:hypothetical protein
MNVWEPWLKFPYLTSLLSGGIPASCSGSPRFESGLRYDILRTLPSFCQIPHENSKGLKIDEDHFCVVSSSTDTVIPLCVSLILWMCIRWVLVSNLSLDTG